MHTEYTLVTFIPKNLYEQFGRVANLFFLGTVIVQRMYLDPLVVKTGTDGHLDLC
jgi:hypothetical protein